MRTATIDRRDTLAKTIEIIKARGWWQSNDSYFEPTKFDKDGKPGPPGKTSVSHAIRLAIAELGGTEYDMWEARYAIMAVVGGRGVESWNDNPKTTKQAMFDVLTKAMDVPVTWENHMAWAWLPPVVKPHVHKVSAGSYPERPFPPPEPPAKQPPGAKELAERLAALDDPKAAYEAQIAALEAFYTARIAELKVEALKDLILREEFFLSALAHRAAEMTKNGWLKPEKVEQAMRDDRVAANAATKALDDARAMIREWRDKDVALLEGRYVAHMAGWKKKPD